MSDLVSAVAAFAAPDTQVTALCTSTPQLTKEDCRGCKVDVQVGPGTQVVMICLIYVCMCGCCRAWMDKQVGLGAQVLM